MRGPHLSFFSISFYIYSLCFNFPAACSLVKCPFNGLCAPGENGGVNCSCIQRCPRLKNTVCANNRLTYYSECAMKKESCKKKTPLKVVHKGNCGENILLTILDFVYVTRVYNSKTLYTVYFIVTMNFMIPQNVLFVLSLGVDKQDIRNYPFHFLSVDFCPYSFYNSPTSINLNTGILYRNKNQLRPEIYWHRQRFRGI